MFQKLLFAAGVFRKCFMPKAVSLSKRKQHTCYYLLFSYYPILISFAILVGLKKPGAD